MLAFHQKSRVDVAAEKKSVDWKVMIAHYLRRHSAVSNGWLSSYLRMGACQAISRYTSEFERSGGTQAQAYRRMMSDLTPNPP